MVYVSETDMSSLFESESVEDVKKFAGSIKQWFEAGGEIEMPQTIGYQVCILGYLPILKNIFKQNGERPNES